ncbi:MAG: GNAT family N-acetyltransferase [Oscillospiraceae bacterium]|nr:GNAT family N-acetyltransferase [Oscillospiraceae bacterium]
MLICVRTFQELDFDALMQVYQEGNRENGEDLYPEETPERQMELALRDFGNYLRHDFFSNKDARYWIWSEDGVYLSALRLEPYEDGLLLEALETHPEYRCRGYAKKLICAVMKQLPAGTRVYSNISKRNTPSLVTHRACGFYKLLDYSVDTDGEQYDHQVTMTVTV